MLDAPQIGLTLSQGEVVGLSGPSGIGKTRLARALMGGDVLWQGQPLSHYRRSPVFYLHQTPLGAIHPRWRIARVLAEAGAFRPDWAEALGVEPAWLRAFAHELSGGQVMRVSILRGLIAHPQIMIADEITAPLDPICQAKVWRLLLGEVRARRMGMLVISHDRALLDHLCDRQFTLGPQGLVGA